MSIEGGLPPLTNAFVVVQPRFNNAITSDPLYTPITLNRPDTTLPVDAVKTDCHFGDHITLEAYKVKDSTVSLYWRTNAPLSQDYQVFVHVVEANDDIIKQIDRTPVDGRYPTSQWKPNTIIVDTYHFGVLPKGYGLRVGLYTLPDIVNLPVMGVASHDVQVLDCVP